MKILGNKAVYVHRPDGTTVLYLTGDRVPDDDAALVTNASVWADATASAVKEAPSTATADAGDTSDEDATWVIRDGDLTLGSRSRWVTHRGTPVEFATADAAQERLEEILPEHPKANIEKIG